VDSDEERGWKEEYDVEDGEEEEEEEGGMGGVI
jgi:hypothetical protein